MQTVARRKPRNKVSSRDANRLFVFIFERWRIDRTEITGPERTQQNVIIRIVSYRYLSKTRGYSQAAIARLFQRDKSTISSALSSFDGLETSKTAKQIIDEFNLRKLRL